MSVPQQRAYGRLAGAVVALVALVVAVPAVALWASRRRFGSANPLAGVRHPWDWSGDPLTRQLDESTIVDLIVRVALCVAWLAVAVILVTTVLEVVHMVRHGGLARPAVRGLGWSQRIARYVATGLLVVAPLLPSSRAAATPPGLPPRPAATPTLVFGSPPTAAPARPASFDPPPAAAPDEYVVRPGDSVYAIAERLAGGPGERVVALADEILDLNLGREMSDGQRFTNAAYIEPGWVLRLPAHAATALPAPGADRPAAATGTVHVVVPGDTLSGIARDRLGDAERWREIWDANAGADMGDGRTLDDPDLILPGWRLTIPAVVPPPPAAPAPLEPPAPSAAPAPASVETAPTTPVPPAAPAPVETVPAETAAAPAETVRSATVPPPALATAPHVSAVATTVAGAHTVPTSTDATATPDGVDPQAVGDPAGPADGSPIGIGQAAMLSAGVLALLGVRRRRRLRAALPRARLPEPRPRPTETERLLRSIDPGERLLRVDVAIRSVAGVLATRERQVSAALVDASGDVELVLTAPCELAPPWTGRGDRWRLPGTTPLELLAGAARAVGAPCVALVQLGTTADGRDVFVDLEALGVLAIEGPADVGDAIVNGIATTLGSSVFAEIAHLVGVGVAPEAFVGHRLATVADSVDQAVELAASLLGTTAAAGESTFALRTRVAGGEAWEPAVVLVAADHADDAEQIGGLLFSRGLAAVVAGPNTLAWSHLSATGPTWRLDPFGIELTPVGLTDEEVAAVSELVAESETPLVDEPIAALSTALVADASTLGTELSQEPYVERDWSLLVRLIGPVEVADRELRPATFERSKARELIAWLSTHRGRSTRTGARTALWELDVRDATFANVVSEARRAMARLVPPPDGVEWLARTLTDELPLHAAVVTDAQLVEERLAAARLQPPELAIRTLTPAVDLIRGMPFEGTSYLWPDAEGITSNLVLLATSAAVELAAHHLSMADIEGVFRATAQGLQVLAGHEELIALRMRAHARAGDHAGIRQEWESYERVLNADPWSDGEPAPKLVSLRSELLAAP